MRRHMHPDIACGHLYGAAANLKLTDVIEAIRNKGKMWDNTLVVFTTDNGGNLGGSGCNYPLRGGKYTFWQVCAIHTFRGSTVTVRGLALGSIQGCCAIRRAFLPILLIIMRLSHDPTVGRSAR